MSSVPAAKIPPKIAPWPFYAADEIAAVTQVLQSGRVNYWTGNEGRGFEVDYAAHCGTKYALSVGNGTLALELAMYAYNIGPGDEVIVPARTFVATASAVARWGAKPVVADVDALSQNMTAETVAAVITPRTKAIIPVHLGGWPVDMTPLMALAHKHGLKVIEDAAQAHGATDRGRVIGGIGDIGCFSFCQDKIITTAGEGGMVVTNDEALYEKMWSYRDHGKDYARATTPDSAAGFKWLVDAFGTNWRLTEPQSALGRVQLKKLPEWLERRTANAAQINAALVGLNAVTLPRPPAHQTHAYYRYHFMVNADALKSGWSRDKICAVLEDKGVPARVGACPDISREAAFKNAGYPQPPHPVAESSGAASIVLPVHPTLTAGDVAFLAETTRAVILEATR